MSCADTRLGFLVAFRLAGDWQVDVLIRADVEEGMDDTVGTEEVVEVVGCTGSARVVEG